MSGRTLVAGVLLMVALAACGEGSQVDDLLGDDPTTTTAGGAAGQPATPTSGAATGSSSGSMTGPAHPAGAGKPSASGEVAATASSASPDGPPGSYAGVLLRAKPATRVVIEMLVAPGAEPEDGSIQRVQAELENASGKTVALTKSAAPADDKVWTAAELRALGRTGRADASDTQAVIRIIFVRGAFEEDKTLGVALSGSLVAIFPDQVAAAGGLLSGKAPLERAVLVHELGHLMGLVDLFLDRGRDDPDHPGHSTNRSSVMYWAVESGLIADVLSGPPPEQFDSEDRADLATIRSGA